MAGRIAARFRVTGRVQGVGFRASTARRARALGLDGVSRNLDDGSVEVLAAGSAEALLELSAWLAHGPPSARVAELTRLSMPADGVAPGFVVR